MRNKKYFIAFIICLVIFFETIALMVYMNFYSKQTKDNTTEFSATIDYITTSNTSDKYADIYTNEYPFSLHITSNVLKKLNIDELCSLPKGTNIFFRIENESTKIMYQSQFCPIISLKINDTDMFSLDDYNNWQKEALSHINVVTFSIALILLCCCCIFLYRINLYKKGL